MDPEELLKELRELSAKIISKEIDNEPNEDFTELSVRAIEFAEKFEALDKWIMSGGFIPKEWKEKMLENLLKQYQSTMNLSEARYTFVAELASIVYGMQR